MDPKTFWAQFGEHAALVALQVGEEVALAFLNGFLAKKFGAPIVTGIVPSITTPTDLQSQAG